MGRLTEYDLQGNPMLCMEGCSWIELLRKLAHYEDLEEQLMESAEIDIDSMVGEFMHYYNLQKENRLIELPCEIEEMVWLADKYGTHQVMYASNSDILHDIELGCGIGFTKEEAEAKLKEMEETK